MNPDIKAPLKEALELLTGQPIPEEQFGDMTGIYHSNQLPEKLAIALEDWCALHARPSWAGGSGTLEAAEVLVSHAVDAGNIPMPEDWCAVHARPSWAGGSDTLDAGNIPMSEVEMPKPKTVKERYFLEYLQRKRGDRP